MVNKDDKNDLTVGTVWKKLLSFFLPIVIGALIQQFYNIVDVLIVGRFVSTTALAAVGGSAASIILITNGFTIHMTAGFSVLIAQLFGAKKTSDLLKSIELSLIICGIIGVFITVLMIIFAPNLLLLLNTPKDTLVPSLQYLRIYISGFIFIIFLNMESSILRALGDSFRPFIYMIICCIMNVVLDYIFVAIFGWQIVGAAVATVISQLLNFTFLTFRLLHLLKESGYSLVPVSLKSYYVLNMLKIGIPSGLQNIMYSGSAAFIQAGVNSLGTATVAAWTMSERVECIVGTTVCALGTAITTFISQNYGAGNKLRMRKCLKQGYLLSLSFASFLSITLFIFGKSTLRLFSSDEGIINVAFQIMQFVLPFYLSWATIDVISSALRGVGDVIVPIIISAIGICVFRVFWIMFVFAKFTDIMVLALSYGVSWTITAIALAIRYFLVRKKYFLEID